MHKTSVEGFRDVVRPVNFIRTSCQANSLHYAIAQIALEFLGEVCPPHDHVREGPRQHCTCTQVGSSKWPEALYRHRSAFHAVTVAGREGGVPAGVLFEQIQLDLLSTIR